MECYDVVSGIVFRPHVLQIGIQVGKINWIGTCRQNRDITGSQKPTSFVCRKTSRLDGQRLTHDTLFVGGGHYVSFSRPQNLL